MLSAREDEERISSPMETVIFETVSELTVGIWMERGMDIRNDRVGRKAWGRLEKDEHPSAS